MDMLAGTVPADKKPRLPNGSSDEHKHLDRIYGKQICLHFHLEHFIALIAWITIGDLQ